MHTALVTGAAGGIGQAICHAFQVAGYRVIATDRDAIPGQFDYAFQIDLGLLCSDLPEGRQFLDKVHAAIGSDGLKVLVNCAAVQRLNRTEDITYLDWEQTLRTNLMAPFFLVQEFLQKLEQAEGSVVNVASIHAIATKPGFVCYATSKAALVGLTNAMAVELGSRVRVNAILPAATETPMLLRGFPAGEAPLEELAKMHPLNRIAEPDEIAQIALFLASDKASFVTGAAVRVDGGIGGRLHDPQ